MTILIVKAALTYALGRRTGFTRTSLPRGGSRRGRCSASRPATPTPPKPGAGLHPRPCDRRVSLGDGLPLAVFRSAFPAERFPGLPGAGAARLDHRGAGRTGGHRLYPRLDPDHRALPTARALLLQVPEGAALLRSEDQHRPRGRPVEYGLTWFAGDRVALTVTPEG